MTSKNIGVLAIGTYLPPNVRTNDWWPKDVVDSWRQRRAAPLDESLRVEPRTPGERAVAEAMAAYRDDPFHGSVERRVIEDGTSASDMEKQAARAAIERAEIDPADIGLLLCNTLAPDFLVTNNACLLHENLGLPRSCFTLATEAACNAFTMQLAIAEQWLRAGRAKYALCVQTCNISPLLDWREPHSPLFGDGCSAVVVGPVSEGRGILSSANKTDGSLHCAIVAGVPGKRWYDGGKVQIYAADHAVSRRSFFGIADIAAEVTTEALAHAGYSRADVDFFAPHQPTPWARPMLAKHLELHRARSFDTFAWATSMFAVNIPIALARAEEAGTLREGDLVLTFAGGAGLTYSSMALRWGR